MINIEPGTKVIVHSKSAGCTLDGLFSRRHKMYPKQAPFTAWVASKYSTNVYTLTYKRFGTGGDYYKEEDFRIDNSDDLFEDGDFLL